MCYRTVVPPMNLLEGLIKRYKTSQHETTATGTMAFPPLRAIALIKTWISTYEDDFIFNPTLSTRAMDFLQGIARTWDKPTATNLAMNIIAQLDKKISSIKDHRWSAETGVKRDVFEFSSLGPTLRKWADKQIFSDLTLHCSDSNVIYAHKAILLHRCSKLQSLKDVDTVQIPFSKPAMIPIIYYLYSGIFAYNSEHAAETTEAIKYLEISKLYAIGMGHSSKPPTILTTHKELFKHSESLQMDMARCWASRAFSDIQIEIDDEIHHLHKVILSARSKTLHQLLTSDPNIRVMVLSTFTRNVKLIKWMYTEDEDLENWSFSELADAFLSFDRLGMPNRFKPLLELAVVKSVSAQNFFKAYELMTLYSSPELDAAVLQCCVENYDRLISDKAWQSVDRSFKLLVNSQLDISKMVMGLGASIINLKKEVLFDYSPEEIARQMTLLDWRIWKKIKFDEFLDLGWTKPDKDEKAPNIVAFTKQFNLWSHWCVTAIMTKDRLRDRQKVMERFLAIVVELHKLNNYSAIKAIWSGFDCTPLYRMKKTRDEVLSRSKWIQIQSDIQGAVSADAKELRKEYSSKSPPLLPYLGLYLTDLVKIYEGNPKVVGDGLINYNRWRLLSITIRGINHFQTTGYDNLITEITPLMQELQTLKVISNTDDLFDISYYMEPREGTEPPARPQVLDDFLNSK
eukprot:TRINITY_DN3427_c0_g1_i3.p1 TRINITY_DN3427_c0_g1~~TRINITY_DN3427_c0_g1_i3.p1  ORF type:complete len:685 (+),score=103.57 TRINITY_DN3427_c0_g1_i3:289-2343(+)